MLYVKNLYKSYLSGSKEYPVLKKINLHIGVGEFVAVMGPSGSGKSTLLNCISCYIPFEKGEIRLGGTALANLDETALAKVRNEKLGFVFQDFMLLDGLTIRENILVPRIIRGNADHEGEELADHLLTLFGIDHIRSKYPAEVSGGERQRAAVVRSLINRPLMILADEPTGNLDSKSGRTVMEAFENARNQMNTTVFMVTHDSFRELEKNGNRSSFHELLLTTIKEMSGDIQ